MNRNIRNPSVSIAQTIPQQQQQQQQQQLNATAP